MQWSPIYKIQEVHAIYRRCTPSLHYLQWPGYWSHWYTLRKNLLSVVLLLVLDGVKETKGGAELTRVGEEAAHTPVAQVPSPRPWSPLRPREVGFLSFAEDILAAVFSSCSPHLGTACQRTACHTGKRRRWIRQKKPRAKEAKSQGWLTAGLAMPRVYKVQEHCQIRVIQEF